MPSGQTPRVIKYSNDFQIVKERVVATGSEVTNQTWFAPTPNNTGGLYLKAQEHTMMRFEEQRDMALLLGEQTDNVDVFVEALGHDVPIKTTEGFYTFTDTGGNTLTYTPGSYSLNNWDAIGDVIEAERPGTFEYVGCDGRAIYLEKENALKDFLNNDTAVFLTNNDWMGYNTIRDEIELKPANAADFYASIGFKGVQKGGFNFGWSQLPEFNDAKGLALKQGSSYQYTFRQQSLLFPYGMVVNKNSHDGEMISAVGYEYKELNGFSRDVIITPLDGVGGSNRIATQQDDITSLNYLSDFCFHGVCANHCIIQKPA